MARNGAAGLLPRDEHLPRNMVRREPVVAALAAVVALAFAYEVLLRRRRRAEHLGLAHVPPRARRLVVPGGRRALDPGRDRPAEQLPPRAPRFSSSSRSWPGVETAWSRHRSCSRSSSSSPRPTGSAVGLASDRRRPCSRPSSCRRWRRSRSNRRRRRPTSSSPPRCRRPSTSSSAARAASLRSPDSGSGSPPRRRRRPSSRCPASCCWPR